MKISFKNIIVLPVIALAAFAATSCDEWTTVDPLDVEVPTVESENPALYAKYLESLRAYKQGDHKVMYVTFSNQPTASSRAHHLTILPDSIDYISLDTPSNLPAFMQEDIETVREKGTKVIYTIDNATLAALYKADKAAYDEEQAAATTEDGDDATEPEPFMTFEVYASEYMNAQLAICDAEGYDGLTLAYAGKSTIHMTEEEIAAYTSEQAAVIAPVAEWKAAHPDHVLFFLGTPETLIDKTILGECEKIIIDTKWEISQYALSQNILASSVEGVPADRFMVLVSAFSMDKTDLKTGYFGTDSAIEQAALWAATPADFNKSGIAVLNSQNDYYNAAKIYPHIREAIETMNPSPKQ